MEKMTIHRGLSELKLIDAKIKRAISDINPVGLMQKDKLVNNVYEKKAFDKDVKSKFQSILDLIERKSKIKNAIISINGITKIEVAGKAMTIADAINLKMTSVITEELISILKSKYASRVAEMNKTNEQINKNALAIVQAALQNKELSVDDKSAIPISKPYIELNELKLVDPIGVEKVTDKLRDNLDNFKSEVDAVLSEINAITHIQI